MNWRTPFLTRIAPDVVRGLWQGESVRQLADRHRCDREDVQRIATEAGLSLVLHRGVEVAREGSGWCMVLVGGKVYARARREGDGRVSLINSGPRAGAVVVGWDEVESYAPVLRYGQRDQPGVRWKPNPQYQAG
jgi:hypothetical protein